MDRSIDSQVDLRKVIMMVSNEGFSAVIAEANSQVLIGPVLAGAEPTFYDESHDLRTGRKTRLLTHIARTVQE